MTELTTGRTTGHTTEDTSTTDQATRRPTGGAAGEPPAGRGHGTAPADAHDNRRQVLYWRLLARLFDDEEQPALESAGLAVVEDIGLPSALLDPQVSVDSIVQRHPELGSEFDGLMAPAPDDDGTRDRAAEVRRAALVSKVLLNVFASGSGAVTAGQLTRWQSDAGWLERALGCRPGELRGGRAAPGAAAGGSGTGAAGRAWPRPAPVARVRRPISAASFPRSDRNSTPLRATWSSACDCVRCSPTRNSPHASPPACP